MFGKYSRRYLFQMQTRQNFFKFRWKLNGPPFYYQNLPDHEFATALLSFACNWHINKCTYLIFVNLKNISQWKRFLITFAKNWKGFFRSMDTEASNFQVRLHFYGNRNWYFIAKIGIRNWYFSAIFICF